MKRLLFPIYLFCNTLLFSQEIKIDTNSIIIREQIYLNITAEFELDEHGIWPTYNDTISKGIEIIEIGNIDSIKTENRLQISQNFIITAWDSGVYYIYPIIFNENKKTEVFVLNVNTIDLEENFTIKDIKENLKAPYGWSDIWPLLLGILLLTIIYFLIKKYFFNNMDKKKTIKKKVVIPADIIALNSLTKLKKEKLWQEGMIKQYHSEISEILRTYLENRFQTLALELPTFDIIKNLRNEGLNSNDLNILSNILQRADLAKFAKSIPVDSENIQSMEKSVIFVNNTKQKNEKND